MERSVKKIFEGLNMFDSANLTLIPMWIKTNRCLAHMKDPYLIDVSSPSKYKSRYKKEMKQR